ncbi:MAG: cysteine-rich CWC family protein [Rubrivivax sp.]|nr:cysteine-rich CWC family protein [Rubrivivax sp.]
MTADTPAAPLPASTCPLCGGPNACVPAQCGNFDQPCWCQSARFSPELLARVPAAQRGNACICAACAAGAVALDSPT